MRITKSMLEAEIKEARKRNSTLADKVRIHEDELKMLRGIINAYSGMTSLIIATERIGDALSHTVSDMRKRNLS